MNRGQIDVQAINKGLNKLGKIKFKSLNNCCTIDKGFGRNLCSEIIDCGSGVYAIWWTGSRNSFKTLINREVTFTGAGGKQIPIRYTNTWIDSLQHENICLYIGKTSTTILQRMKQQLQLTAGDFATNNSPFGRRFRKLIQKHSMKSDFNYQSFVIKNIGISYIELDGIRNCVNRFYLEDKAIGKYYPLLNVDIER